MQRRASRYDLQKYLRGNCASEEAEKAAMTRWAVHQKDGSIENRLFRKAEIGIPVEPVWSLGLYACMISVAAIIAIYCLGLVGIIAASAIYGGLGFSTVPALTRYLLNPHARRAALWLAWLGAPEAVPFLTRALWFATRTKAQRAWVEQVEAALADLLDGLQKTPVPKEAHQNLCEMVLRAYPKWGASADRDLTEGRASLLIAALRYLFSTSEKDTLSPLLNRIVTRPVNERAQPYRFLVRELALMYRECPPEKVPTTLAVKLASREPSLASLRALLTRRI